jgi:hypothetical protein
MSLDFQTGQLVKPDLLSGMYYQVYEIFTEVKIPNVFA